MARSTSSLAALRAGNQPAPRPARAAASTNTASWPTGTEKATVQAAPSPPALRTRVWSSPRPRPAAGGPQVLTIELSQACAPSGSMVMSMVAASIDSMRQPAEKLALISFRLTRRGPHSPGWRSLKHNMW